jgi:regulator of sigma E protease
MFEMSTVYDFLIAVGAAVVALGVLIVMHELGHFLVAKKSGVGVLTFSIGFGKKLLVKKLGQTEYCISAIPFGGYVKMIGEDPDQEVDEADRSRAFSHQSLAKRFAIVAAGPVFNLLLAAFIFLVVFFVHGVPYITTEVGSVEPDSPAAKAGLEAGDQIVRAGKDPVKSWQELKDAVEASKGKPLALLVARGGNQLPLIVQPRAGEGRNIFGEVEKTWLIGVVSAGKTAVEEISFFTAAWEAVSKTADFSFLTLETLGKMVTMQVSPRNLGGPVMIAQVAGEQVQRGAREYLLFLAVLSINLGILNLLPIPVLDGGHLLFFFAELLRGRPLDVRQREVAQQVGLVLLMLVMVYALFNDFSRFFQGGP